MQMVQRIHSLAPERNDAALLLGAYRALACTLYFMGDFEAARQYAMRGLQIWRAGDVQSLVEEVHPLGVLCLAWEATSEWHLGEILLCQATIAEAIALAKELNDAQRVSPALWLAAILAHFERNPVEVTGWHRI